MPRYIAIQKFADREKPYESVVHLTWGKLTPKKAAELTYSYYAFMYTDGQDATVTFWIENEDGSREQIIPEMQPAKKVFHHDDPPCEARLDDHGFCPQCNLHPDMQDLCFFLYCVACDCKLNDLKCLICKQTFENPSKEG